MSKFILQQAGLDVPEPSIPRIPHPTYNPNGEEEGEWIEDPFAPDFLKSQEQARNERILHTLSAIMDTSVEIVSLPKGAAFSIGVFERRGMGTSKIAILQSFAVRTKEDLSLIIENAAVTESRVQRFFNGLQMTRDGEPIDQAGLRNAIDVGIRSASITIGNSSLISAVEEYEACIYSQMDWHKWSGGIYSLDFMAQAIALHRAVTLKQVHTSDAVTQAAKEKQKKG